MGEIIDGKLIAATVFADVKRRAAALAARGNAPGLATILVGDDPASHVYVGQKLKKCAENGIVSFHKPLPASVSQDVLMRTIAEMNENPQVHGILVQLPLPKHLDAEAAVRSIRPEKDADGLHPLNQGLIGRMKSWSEIVKSGVPIPCTPAGVIQMLLHEKIPVEGRHAVVVGRSTLVGKPVSILLLSLNATVTVAHSKTPHLNDVCRTADILVAALGQPKALGAGAVKPGATVIDVGISRTSTGLVGDVDFEAAKPVAGRITPVPGGVGAMTVAMLLQNTVTAAEGLLENALH